MTTGYVLLAVLGGGLWLMGLFSQRDAGHIGKYACISALIWAVSALASRAQENGIASVYGEDGDRLSTGERFDGSHMALAHRTLPFRTVVLVINPANHKRAHLRVSDRGPCASPECQHARPDLRKRIVDLTPAAAEATGVDGLARVVVKVCKVEQLGTDNPELPVIPLMICS